MCEHEWKSIESAPKDGTRIIGFDGESCFCCHYSRDFASWITGFAPNPFDKSNMLILSVVPTHWMPLPQAPTAPEVE